MVAAAGKPAVTIQTITTSKTSILAMTVVLCGNDTVVKNSAVTTPARYITSCHPPGLVGSFSGVAWSTMMMEELMSGVIETTKMFCPSV